MKKIFLFACTITFCCSCFDLLGNKNQDEPVYRPNIVWQTKTNYQLSWAYPFESEGYGYYPEDYYYPGNSAPCSRLLKIDLNNGKIMWRTKDVPAHTTDQAQKIGGHIYLPLHGKEIIMVYNDKDGELAATVSLNPSTPGGVRRNGVWGCHTAVWEKYIFWGNSDNSSWSHQGLMRFDIDKIDFSNDPETIQLIEPELVWPITWQSGIWTNILIKDDIVYFLTTRHWWSSGTVEFSYLVALDAETLEELWVTKRDHGRGDRGFSLLINEDRLYVIDMAPACYDRLTGKPIFEKSDDDDIYEYTDAGASLKGISWYNNKLYYTTGMHSHTHLMDSTADPKRVKNIICINGDTGDLVWGDLVPNGGTIDTFPLVNKGKAYVMTDRGLRVYNAETGKLIGVDKTITDYGVNHNLLYDNMVIYHDWKGKDAKPAYSILTAIRAD